MSKPLLIHVLDDDSAVRDSIGELLKSAGYNVWTHDCAKSLFENFRPGEAGCLIVDMQMPDITGLEVQDRIANAGSGVPIIVITGHGDIRTAVAAMKHGASEFLEKPVDQQILLAHVDKVMKSREFELDEQEKIEEAQAKFGVLTPREKDVLKHLLVGRPNKIIARELGLSPRTVEIHRARVMEKTGAGSLPRLVRMALAAGMDPENSHADRG